MLLDEAFTIVANHYGIDTDIMKTVLNSYISKNEIHNNKKIILPFCGKINEDCCKGIVFNHGLYTQCTKIQSAKFCKICINQKYGSIEDRKKY